MRAVLWLSFPWLLGLLFCDCARRGAPEGDTEAYRPLLDRLPPQADLVAVVDLAEAARTYRALLQRMEKTPVVAENPPLRMAVALGQSELEAGLGAIRERTGLDVLRDLERAAVALQLRPDAPPEAFLAVRGNFSPGLLGKLLPADARRLGPDREAYQLDGRMSVELDSGGVLVLRTAGRAGERQDATDSAARLLEAHPRLLAPASAGMFLRVSYATPKWLSDVANSAGAMRWLATDVPRAEVELGPGMRFAAEGAQDRAVENLRLLAEGWKEFTVGGRSLWRAYIFMLLGLNLGELPGLPPEVVAALENRKAVLATVEEFLGEPTAPPAVKVEGRWVSFHADGKALMGSTFVLGIMAAIAVPAFISYIRKSKLTESAELLRALRAAEEEYRLRHGRYLVCGPVPAAPPGKDSVPWPDSSCFDELGFKPETNVYFRYQALLDEDGRLRCRAIGDIDGDGEPSIWELGPDDRLPRQDPAGDEW